MRSLLEELKQAIDEAVTFHAAMPHTALDNVSPRDVYAGKTAAGRQKKIDFGTQETI
jgi:hypothetical protein